MLVSDLLHSCANESVAEAAVASIGGAFALDVHAEASGLGAASVIMPRQWCVALPRRPVSAIGGSWSMPCVVRTFLSCPASGSFSTNRAACPPVRPPETPALV